MTLNDIYLNGFKKDTYFPHFAAKRESLVCFLMSKEFTPTLVKLYDAYGEEKAGKLFKQLGTMAN